MSRNALLLFVMTMGLYCISGYSEAGRINYWQGRNSISGHVFNTSRRPIERLRVELLDEVETVLASVITDSSGRYQFNNLSEGTFQIRVLTHGTNYISQTTRVTIRTLSLSGNSAQFEQVHFTLKSRDEVRTPPSSLNAGTTFVQDVPDNARKAYEEAVKLLDDKKDIEEGIRRLESALDIFTDYYLALERLGMERVKRREYKPAIEILTRATGINSRGHLSYYALGMAHYQLKETTEAVESLSRSLSLAPNSANAAYIHLYLGQALIREGKFKEAEHHLKKAHELGADTSHADAHMHLAQYYSNNNRYAEAADELETYLKEVPDAQDTERIRYLIDQLRKKARQSGRNH